MRSKNFADSLIQINCGEQAGVNPNKLRDAIVNWTDGDATVDS
jgi:hypothetical protein